jgi:hypothetical protein
MSTFERSDQFLQKTADNDAVYAYLLGHRVMDDVMLEIQQSLTKYKLTASMHDTLNKACIGDRMSKLFMLLFAMWLGDVQISGNPRRCEKFPALLNEECTKMLRGKYVNIHDFINNTITLYII